jgi:hypothetical protein
MRRLQLHRLNTKQIYHNFLMDLKVTYWQGLQYLLILNNSLQQNHLLEHREDMLQLLINNYHLLQM